MTENYLRLSTSAISCLDSQQELDGDTEIDTVFAFDFYDHQRTLSVSMPQAGMVFVI